ncbi:uncharacterized protein [Diadema setosum]|uniref:uncharacterized protein n=1 Tax=Diadema setosum TaxID=31175 RepID=UPI003B3BCD5A
MAGEKAEMLDLCARLCLSPQILQHDSEMSACYFLTNPRDSSINITGFPMGGPYQTSQPTRGSNRISSAITLPTSSQQLPGDRHVPVLTVKRRTGPTTISAPFTTQGEDLQDVPAQNGARVTNGGSYLAFGRPAPPVDCFQSRTPIAQRVRNCSRAMRSGSYQRPLTDVRTGFMRTMSKPTPGELDLKHHQEQQALDKLKADLRREKAALEDPDRLDIKEIIRLVEEKHPPISSRAHRPRPRAAKRRVAHASLVAEERRPHISEDLVERDAKTAISEYKHRLQALSSQMRSSRDRTTTRSACNPAANGVDTQSLRLAPNYNDRLMSIQLLSIPDGSGKTSPHGSVDEHSSRSFPLQSRLSPRNTYTSPSASDEASSLSSPRRSRQPLYPDPIYIPSANDDCDVTIGGGDAPSRVRLSMRRSNNQTRETSLLSDMDPMNASKGTASAPIRTVTLRMRFPNPTVPPTNTPVSEIASDDELDFDDDDSLATNWSSRSCLRMSTSVPSSRQSGSSTPTSRESSKKTEISVVIPHGDV